MFNMFQDFGKQLEENNKRWEELDLQAKVLQAYLDGQEDNRQTTRALCKTMLLILEQLRPLKGAGEEVKDLQKDLDKLLNDLVGKMKK